MMRKLTAAIVVILAIVAFTAISAGSGSGKSQIQASEPCAPCGSDGGTGTELVFDPTQTNHWLAWFEDYGEGDTLDADLTAEVDVSGDKAVLVNTEPVGGSNTPTSDPVLTAGLT
jgi:hypothetical protein